MALYPGLLFRSHGNSTVQYQVVCSTPVRVRTVVLLVTFPTRRVLYCTSAGISIDT